MISKRIELVSELVGTILLEINRDDKDDNDLPLNFHPTALRASAGLVRSPLLDRRKVEFSGLCHAGGLDAPAGVMRETGGLLPMAPCGRSSL